MANRTRKWTDEKVNELRILAAQSLYAADIGEKMGLSKNKIVGACMRYKIKLLQVSRRPPVGTPPKTAPVKKTIRRQGFNSPAPAELLKPSTFKPRKIIMATLNLSLFDLADRQCRYPVTDEPPHLFCGLEQKADSSYCPDHHALCNRRSQDISGETQAFRRARTRKHLYSTRTILSAEAAL